MTSETPHYFLDFRKEMNQRFDAIDKKFEAIDSKFIAINQRFTNIETKLDTSFEAIGELMVKVTGIETMLHKNRADTLKINSRVGRLEKRELDFLL